MVTGQSKNTYNREDPYGCRSVPHHNDLLIYFLYFPSFLVLQFNLGSFPPLGFDSTYLCVVVVSAAM